MAARDVRKNFNAFIDGKGYAGQVEEFNAPKLTLKTEDFRGGGMDLPVEIEFGQEKMEADVTLLSYDRAALGRWGLGQGTSVPFTVREELQSHDGTVTGVVHNMRGTMREIDPGTSKAGEKSTMKIAFALSYYKLTHGGVVVHEIDAINMVRIVNGVDVKAASRAALGI